MSLRPVLAVGLADLAARLAPHVTPASIGAVEATRFRTGTGSPEGVVTAPVGTTYTDTAATAGAVEWTKWTGTGYVGAESWVQIERNTLVNTATATSPQAYGIDTGGVARVRVRGNRTRGMQQHIMARSGGDLLINDNDGPKTTNSTVTTASFTKVTSDLVA